MSFNYPDRSDSPAFYDPEHPANNMMPTTGEHWYEVDVLCDDGEEFHWEGWAHNEDDACGRAWSDAEERQQRPADITHWTRP